MRAVLIGPGVHSSPVEMEIEGARTLTITTRPAAGLGNDASYWRIYSMLSLGDSGVPASAHSTVYPSVPVRLAILACCGAMQMSLGAVEEEKLRCVTA